MRSGRWYLAILVAGLVLSLGSPVISASPEAGVSIETYTEGALAIKIDGVDVEFDPAPYILPPGRTMVPLRAFFETLGASVEWDPATRTVTGSRGERQVRLTIGERLATVDGHPIPLDVTPEIHHDRTFVPLRFVAEALDCTVTYEPARRQIAVESRVRPLGRLTLQKGMQLRFRLTLIRLSLADRWEITIDDTAGFPKPVSYTLQSTLGGEPLPAVKRTLVALRDSRKFFPVIVTAEAGESVPWISAQLYSELKNSGYADRFWLGGYGVNGQRETSLRVLQAATLVFSLDGNRVQASVLEAATPSGDRLWILDDPANPLVLKFEPVGLPVPGAIGNVGYQIDSIASDR